MGTVSSRRENRRGSDRRTTPVRQVIRTKAPRRRPGTNTNQPTGETKNGVEYGERYTGDERAAPRTSETARKQSKACIKEEQRHRESSCKPRKCGQCYSLQPWACSHCANDEWPRGSGFCQMGRSC